MKSDYQNMLEEYNEQYEIARIIIKDGKIELTEEEKQKLTNYFNEMEKSNIDGKQYTLEEFENEANKLIQGFKNEKIQSNYGINCS